MGLLIGAFAKITPEFMDSIIGTTQKFYPEQFAKSGFKPDLMMPIFILKYLQNGLIGVFVVGILSAAMSTVSSNVNSLSAVTVEDLFNRGKEKLSEEKYIRYSKYSIIYWGVVCIGSAYLFGKSL